MSDMMPGTPGDTNPTTRFHGPTAAAALLLNESGLWPAVSPERALKAVREAARTGALPSYRMDRRLMFREDELQSQAATDAFRAEILAEAAEPGIPRSHDRKVGYVVAQRMGDRLMIEAFREVNGEWAPSRVMTAQTAKELADEFFEALMSLGGESRG